MNSTTDSKGKVTVHSVCIRIRKAGEVCLRRAIHSDTRVAHETDFL
jgi:hypothetical protein